MQVLSIIGLLLSGFALGMAVTNLIYLLSDYKRSSKKSKDAHHSGDNSCNCRNDTDA